MSNFQENIDRIKALGSIQIKASADHAGSFDLFAGGGQQTNTFSNAGDINTINAIFGENFYQEQLQGGNFDSLAVDGIISGSFNDEGAFSIDLSLGSVEGGGGSLDFTETGSTETGSGSPSASTPAGAVDNTGSVGATDIGATTATGTSGSNGGTSGSFGTGTGSTFDQGLQTQAQLFGQQAYNAQQQKNAMLEALGSNNPGNQIDLATLISSITGNQGTFGSDAGLAANAERQKLLKRQGRGTASTKVKDKIQTQALLSTPTLLGDDS